MTVLVALDGVLRTPTGAPIPEGISLYAMLCQGFRVTLCLDGPLSQHERWLLNNGFTMHDDVMDDSLAMAGMDLRDRQVDVARNLGSVEMHVDPSPERVARSFQKGIVSLLFLKPAYLRPEFRPDLAKPLRPWAAIAEEIDAQAELERDKRLAPE